MNEKLGNWIGACLSGSAVALAYLNLEEYFMLPGSPALWVAAVGGLAGLAGALLMRRLDARPRGGVVTARPAAPAVAESPWQVDRLFLFNTLHNAAALTVADPERARMVIEKLAQYIRLAHELDQQPTTLLNLEMRCAAMFLSIERARFGERLQLTDEVAPECLERRVPSLLLQPLAAYAVRAGVERTDAAVTVSLRARLEGSALLLELRHDGPGGGNPFAEEPFPEDPGLRALAERLRELYGTEASFEIEPLEPQGEALRILLPIDGSPGGDPVGPEN
ncbi:MAG TPA: histidine kinase [bacterium]|nr:histidine kinase [bacterium]